MKKELDKVKGANIIPTNKQTNKQTNTTYILNPMPDGTCRTIKNQYFKTSISNFMSHGSFGATGVIEKRGNNTWKYGEILREQMVYSR